MLACIATRNRRPWACCNSGLLPGTLGLDGYQTYAVPEPESDPGTAQARRGRCVVNSLSPLRPVHSPGPPVRGRTILNAHGVRWSLQPSLPIPYLTDCTASAYVHDTYPLPTSPLDLCEAGHETACPVYGGPPRCIRCGTVATQCCDATRLRIQDESTAYCIRYAHHTGKTKPPPLYDDHLHRVNQYMTAACALQAKASVLASPLLSLLRLHRTDKRVSPMRYDVFPIKIPF